MNLFLGDKSEIGVEVQFIERDKNNSLTGYARLWFGGHFVGTIYDFIYLDGYLLGGLFEITRVPFLNQEVLPSNFENLYNYFFDRLEDENDEEIYNYLINFGTMADNFHVWAFKKDDNITIGWKLRNAINPYHLDLLDYPSSAFFYTVNYETLVEFIERLDRILKNW
jgi:hypothetical protein